MPNYQSEFKWNVQPYRWLYEMRDNYTQAIEVVTRSTAHKMAGEATEWMKQNAPWKDRTGDARSGLLAEVLEGLSDADILRMKQESTRVQRQDIKLLKKMNVERVKQGQIKLSKLPTKLSGHEALIAQRKKNVSTLLKIRFSHDPRLKYAIWLEVAHGGRFSIIDKALSYWGRKMVSRIQSNANLVQFKGKDLTGQIVDYSQQGFEEARFTRYAEATTKANGRTYQPWSSEKRATRARGRSYRRRKGLQD